MAAYFWGNLRSTCWMSEANRLPRQWAEGWCGVWRVVNETHRILPTRVHQVLKT